jgi:hypothetical protein
MTTTTMKRTPERAALAIAVDRHKSLLARQESIDAALSRTQGQIWTLEEKVKAAERDLGWARHERVRALISTALESEIPEPKLPDAEADKVHRELEGQWREALRIKDKLMAEDIDCHRQIEYSQVDLRSKARAVVRSEAATDRLIDDYVTIMRSYVAATRLIDYLKASDMLSVENLSRIGEEPWPELDAERNKWDQAVARLENDANALLPIGEGHGS